MRLVLWFVHGDNCVGEVGSHDGAQDLRGESFVIPKHFNNFVETEHT